MGFLCIYLSTNHVMLRSPVLFAACKTESLRLYIYVYIAMLLQSESAGAFILEPESFLFRFVPRLANRWLDAGFVRRYRCHVLDCFIYERKTCVSCAGKHHMRRGVWSPKVRGEGKKEAFPHHQTPSDVRHSRGQRLISGSAWGAKARTKLHVKN